MKLINSTFDSSVLDDRIYDKRGRVRDSASLRSKYGNRYYRYRGDVLDFEEAEIELDRTLGHVYKNERLFQPHKQNIRMRWCRDKHGVIEWWDERPGGAGNDNWSTIRNIIEGHIQKWMGRKFDDCFADFKRKFFEDRGFRVQAGGMGTTVRGRNDKFLWKCYRNKFLDYFEGHRWGEPVFQTDDDGIIYETPIKFHKPCRDIIVYGDGKIYYKVNLIRLRACHRLFESIPSKVYNEMMITGTVDFDTVRRLTEEIDRKISKVRNAGRPWDTNWSSENFKCLFEGLPTSIKSRCTRGLWGAAREVRDYVFELVDERERRVIKYGTKEWKKLKKKRKKAKPDHSKYDRSLWAQKSPRGFGFHQLMENDLNDLKRWQTGVLLEDACTALRYVCDKNDIKEARERFMLNWTPKQWFGNSYIYSECIKQTLLNDIQRKNTGTSRIESHDC